MSQENNSKEEIYSLETILSTITKVKNNTAKKRLIFDQAPIGGISVKWVIAFLISLPILLYAGIFNPTMFQMLGIAQAIIFFIVFLSMVMILSVAVVFINNNKVTRDVTISWNRYFKDVDLKLALSSGSTPYKDFFKHYNLALKENLTEKALEKRLQEIFATMEEENQILMEAIRRNQNRR
ncbi:MAG: Unknown protein [uncultured Sulfurovum sp.]|uniref:Uncharacterized protein n=1 Tax=uncultured Sulfurovum sp. TaxID=269237 RepID=A0A6S6SHK1_9BACT|nr:MAG: Unknown protein [uncultured Sulfurovum sp.]